MNRGEFVLLSGLAAAGVPPLAAARPLKITKIRSIEVRDVPTGKGLVLPWGPKQIPQDTRHCRGE